MVRIKPLIVFSIRLFLLLFILAAIGALIIWVTIVPSLPSVESLRDIQLQVPLRIYSADDRLMAEIGEQRRRPVAVDDVPERLKLAFLSAEDDRFYQHPGVDWRGTLRAVWLYSLSMGQGRVPGGSTVTQQVARRFFLSTDYSVTRKLREMLLAFKVESELSKDEILELYLNKEFLGHRAYGVAAAAQVYYGKTLDELTLAEMAMIAGLPKAPSRDNPISGPQQAMGRRNWILGRMLELGHISETEHAEAVAQPNTASYHGPVVELDSPWVAEMARQDVVDQVGSEAAYSDGLIAHTTVRSELQEKANRVVRDGLMDYDRRHGWRGPEDRVSEDTLDDPETLAERLDAMRPIAGLLPAVVTATDETSARFQLADGTSVELDLEALSWARPFVSSDAVGAAPQAAGDVVAIGDIVRLKKIDEEWQLAQIPQAEAALVSMKAETGELLALVGGLDFAHSQFNRATQSRRQPGSAFKPFIYSAALDHGYTPASRVNDAPVVIDDPSMEREWKPTNFSHRFFGPTRLREAMVNSRNLVSVRLLMDMGIEYGRDYVTRFGFERDQLPNGPSMALGSASITPLSLTAGYATFANGGHRVEPHYLYSISDTDGETLFETEWALPCRDCPEIPPPNPPAESTSSDETAREPMLRRPELADAESDSAREESDQPDTERLMGPPRPKRAEQVLRPQTAWLIDSMMSDVIRRGTGRRALALERDDLAGKTGTTNDQRDTWFAGYGGGIVTVVWVGMDDNESLGRQEQGGRTALPLWVDFMDTALEGRPETRRPVPVGVTRALIDPETGLRARPGTPDAIQEWFHADNLPPLESSDDSGEQADPYEVY
ncbi:penicillin-binding protein 1A [Wenzhouxiangella sp. 15181]|nr:penicillin-binding protein 1A [Wenzhouxiangella sp. 15181]RFP70041.1 penicillin-binding protein 1A [Wenzhouxiangella sp. 15190]